MNQALNGHVLFVSATGSGKTRTFSVPASIFSNRITLLIVPLVALRIDHLKSLKARSWSDLLNPKACAGLVIVSAEEAASADFENWVAAANYFLNLRQVVIDEVHLFLTSDYRPKLWRVIPFFSRVGIPILFLSATMPLELVTILEGQLGSPISVIRAQPIRKNICYQVNSVEPKKVLDIIQKGIDKSNLNVVFVKTKKRMNDLALALSTSFKFHGDLDQEEKARIMKDFVESEGGTMVATTAFGAGVNIPNITRTFHIGCYSLLSFAQESGRAGRSGQRAVATLILDEDPGEFEPFLHDCIRRVLHQRIDNVDIVCQKGVIDILDVNNKHN